jgi:hypothetical protein
MAKTKKQKIKRQDILSGKQDTTYVKAMVVRLDPPSFTYVQ